jgi:hypothetical protein
MRVLFFSIQSILVQHNVVEWVVQDVQSAGSAVGPAAAHSASALSSSTATATVSAVLAVLKRNNVVLHRIDAVSGKLNAKEAKAQRALHLQQLHALTGGGSADVDVGATVADDATTKLFLEGLHSASLEAAVVACKQVGVLSGASGTFRLLPGTSKCRHCV